MRRSRFTTGAGLPERLKALERQAHHAGLGLRETFLNRSGDLLPARVRRRDDAGFALAMVVFLLFAVSIASLTGYQVVSVEARLASGKGDADVALTTANAGLHRYVAERIGEPGPDTYLIGPGSGSLLVGCAARGPHVVNEKHPLSSFLRGQVGQHRSRTRGMLSDSLGLV